ncbi:MAG TPA: cyclic nucleotide-binding domain-containing protein, partial [Polyangiaceae bacterium]|nr:cyclic nucleotide-binding domain-containing protein [Polyangiaceae bacterium]
MSATPTPGRFEDAFDAVFRAELLRALDDRGRADVRASGKLRHVAPGSPIVHAGDPADTLLVVARGLVRLESASGAGAAGGRELRAGELFGHEALVPFAARPARVLAVESSSIVELPVSVLERALVRAGFPELFVREEARARRAEWLGLLAKTALGALPPGELAALARGLVELPRRTGEVLDSAGVRGEAVWLVAGG